VVSLPAISTPISDRLFQVELGLDTARGTLLDRVMLTPREIQDLMRRYGGMV
jgi:hypothetical protein